MVKKKEKEEKPELEPNLSDPSFWNRPFISRKRAVSNKIDEVFSSDQECEEEVESENHQDSQE